MTTPIELEDGQHQLGPILVGKGTAISIAEFEGLGMPALRTGDVEPPGTDGLWLGADYYGGRTLHLDAAVKVAGNSTAVLDQLSALLEVADDLAIRGQGGTTMDLRLKFPGRDVRVVRGRLRKAESQMAQYKHGWLPLDLEFQAADHLYYADAFDVTTIPLGMLTTGGLTFPLEFPFVINGDPAAVGRPGYLEVAGTAPTWPVLRVTGPCANPTITHVSSGRVLSVQTTLAADEWVEIDTRPGWRTVLRENGGGVPLTPTSRIDKFQLPPGINEVRWTATDNTLTSSLAVAWWPAWKAL